MWGGYLKGISSVWAGRESSRSSFCAPGSKGKAVAATKAYCCQIQVYRRFMVLGLRFKGLGCRAWLRILDLKFSAMKENQMEKKMEHGMETEILQERSCLGLI